MTTSELVEIARDANAGLPKQHAAFTRLVDQFQRMALSVAAASLDDLDLARVGAQEAFIDAWRKLHCLHEPAAFGAWLRRLVLTHCARIRRRNAGEAVASPVEPSPGGVSSQETADVRGRVFRAVERLPHGEREAVVRFYFLGERLASIAEQLGVRPGTIGKRLYSARLRLRRALPRELYGEFVRRSRSRRFVDQVQQGVFDEFTGEYRFARRPGHPVCIRREGTRLVAEAGGQRNVLASCSRDTLVTTEFDGEGTFERDRKGRITRFVYYEFGRRIGVAERVPRAEGAHRPHGAGGARRRDG